MQALSQLSYTPNEAAHFIDAAGACKASVRKKFARIEQAEGIELLLHGAHQGEGRRVDLESFGPTNAAVFAQLFTTGNRPR